MPKIWFLGVKRWWSKSRSIFVPNRLLVLQNGEFSIIRMKSVVAYFAGISESTQEERLKKDATEFAIP